MGFNYFLPTENFYRNAQKFSVGSYSSSIFKNSDREIWRTELVE